MFYYINYYFYLKNVYLITFSLHLQILFVSFFLVIINFLFHFLESRQKLCLYKNYIYIRRYKLNLVSFLSTKIVTFQLFKIKKKSKFFNSLISLKYNKQIRCYLLILNQKQEKYTSFFSKQTKASNKNLIKTSNILVPITNGLKY